MVLIILKSFRVCLPSGNTEHAATHIYIVICYMARKLMFLFLFLSLFWPCNIVLELSSLLSGYYTITLCVLLAIQNNHS